MSHSVRNVFIGIFLIAACVTIVSMIFFLHPSVGDRKQILFVRFADVNQINIGTRVLYAGLPVGDVTAIQEIAQARAQPVDSDGNVYVFQLTLEVDSSIQVLSTDLVRTVTTGLLGEKSIAIIPQAPPPGVTSVIVTTQPIYGDSEDPLQHTISEMGSLARKIEGSIDHMEKWIGMHGQDLASALSSFRSAMDQTSCALTRFNQSNLIDTIEGAVQNFSGSILQLQSLLQEIEEGRLIENSALTMRNLKKASDDIALIIGKIAAGKGTVGEVINSDALYVEITTILQHIDSLIEAMNRYGLLFHLNKSWQRLQVEKSSSSMSNSGCSK
jgi:phospholipid/cholesterol/gamma-HCH transport system substrate-binding protein